MNLEEIKSVTSIEQAKALLVGMSAKAAMDTIIGVCHLLLTFEDRTPELNYGLQRHCFSSACIEYVLALHDRDIVD